MQSQVETGRRNSMRRVFIALLLAGCTLAAGPRTSAYADDVNQNPECQRMWMQLAGPVVQRMMYFVQAGDQYPLLPNGRPSVGSFPAPYPWAPAIYGPGGPGYGFAGAYAANGVRSLGLTGAPGYPFATFTPPGGTPLTLPFVANQVVQGAGGIGAVGAGDLIGLADVRQSQIGNVLGAIDVRNNIVGTRLAAADFNLNYAGYPMAQAVNYREVLEGLDFHVRNACPRAPAEDNGSNGSSRP
jgi:hypothetical protein